MTCFDCTKEQMMNAAEAFEKRLQKESFEATLFYYAGHGIRINGVNYVVPVGTEGLTQATAEFECIKVNKVMDILNQAEGSTNVLILDACLNNPFDEQGMWRDMGGRLPEWAHTLPPSGTFAAYATEPGKRSSDGSGNNGLYTSKLIKYLKVPNLSLEQVFKFTRQEVMEESEEKQVPWESNRTVGNFYFNQKILDNDGDGIPNNRDACPNESGIRAYNGCPPTAAEAPTPTDSDGDGVPNKYDQCPDEVGLLEYDGCLPPVEKGNAAVIDATAESKASASSKKRDLPREFTEQIDGLRFTMKLVEGGSFTMGCADTQGGGCPSSERPSHQVTVSDFYMAETEVTQDLYQAVTGSRPSSTRRKRCGHCPVEMVEWQDAQKFVKKLNKKSDRRYRLPTEAEWEFAARGGAEAQGAKYAGSNVLSEVAWSQYNSGDQPHPVKRKKANELGLYDMTGNVWEWCEDDWHASYNGAPSDGSAWVESPRASYRVSRGGSWDRDAKDSRIQNRTPNNPTYKSSDIGFRIVVDAP